MFNSHNYNSAGTEYSVEWPGYGWMPKRMWFDSFNGQEIYLFSITPKLDSVFFPQSWNDWAMKMTPLTPTGTKIKLHFQSPLCLNDMHKDNFIF